MELQVSYQELCEYDEIDEAVVLRVVEYNIAAPVTGRDVASWHFRTTDVSWIHKALRLRRDLDIDWIAVATIIDLLKQQQSLAEENRRLRQQLRRFFSE
ncbi:chaperone modulator CbpM [Pseudohalioglobus sediminis]|nr:chaperone modulator CbpM [Pseudohalioglobus sediminis]